MTNEVAVMGLEGLNVDAVDSMRVAGTGVEKKLQISKLTLFHNTPYGDCIHPNGSWVVGLTKHTKGAMKGKIENQGKKVLKFTILAQRKQYNHFPEDIEQRKLQACSSNFFIDFREEIKGSKHKVKCHKDTCIYRAMSDKGCKCQIVILGIAHCEDGTDELAIYYAKGAAFSPTSDLLKEGYTVTVGDRRVDLECFMAPISLYTSDLKVKGSVSYFEPIFRLEAVHPQNEWEALRVQTQEAIKYFEGLNASKNTDEDAEDEPVGMATATVSVQTQAQQTMQQPAQQTMQQPAQQTMQQPAQNTGLINQQIEVEQPDALTAEAELNKILNM